MCDRQAEKEAERRDSSGSSLDRQAGRQHGCAAACEPCDCSLMTERAFKQPA